MKTFTLPDLGEGLTEATLVRWLVGVGDTVTIDQPVAELETAKSIVEVPSPFGGTIGALHGAEGDTLAVGAPLIEVEEANREAKPADPEAVRGGSGNVLIGYGTSPSTGRRRRAPLGASGASAPVTASASSTATAPAPHTGPVPVISPIVRKLARDEGVDLHRVQPTGPDGVITRQDVLAQAHQAAPLIEPAEISASRRAELVEASINEEGAVDDRTGLSVRTDEQLGMLRRTAAEKFSRSRSEIPEATVWVDVDVTRLWKLRERLLVDGQRMSLTAFLAKFTLLALADYPVLASRLSDDSSRLTTFEGVNLGVATDTPRGLMVPVLRHAEQASLADLDQRLRELGERARAGAAQPAELTGSTFTLNNYGTFGVDGSAAIINHPEVAILGLGRVIERPWVVNGRIRVRRIAQLSLAFDHRVCDGGYASGFLGAVVAAIENPSRLLLKL
ncbi:dihydrolipoamide acetyltransferase family protein [Diaminobutyricimonas sp. LJ205]|uniref:dihydrolipoamide acetyltransferase family protein n=1 Tax=Diaminobutyricimonas sp. LJ205 TaxID=2683590 RepID=UPI0012F4BFD1|nr:dihydrolipoamide acetyltransferase family protein [Diaminobutyricimonas sp. LJ205]